MKFGVVLPVEGAVTRGVPDARTVLAMAPKAEESGFSSLWVGDRLLLSPRLEPFSTLGAAALAKNVNLGMAVLLAPLRHPVLLAQMLASLDVLSRL